MPGIFGVDVTTDYKGPMYDDEQAKADRAKAGATADALSGQAGAQRAGSGQNIAAAQDWFGQGGQDYLSARQAGGVQQSALGLLQSAAQGQQPSVAQLQAQQGMDQAIRAQMAAAGSTRGGGYAAAAAMRNAQDQGTQLMNQNTQTQALLRAQEMATARGQFSQAADQYRQSQLAQAALGAQYGSQVGQLGLGQGQLANQTQGAALGYEGLGQQYQGLAQQGDIGRMNNAYGASAQNAQTNASMLSGGLGAAASIGGALLMASDERRKTMISPLDAGTRAGTSKKPALGLRYDYEGPGVADDDEDPAFDIHSGYNHGKTVDEYAENVHEFGRSPTPLQRLELEHRYPDYDERAGDHAEADYYADQLFGSRSMPKPGVVPGRPTLAATYAGHERDDDPEMWRQADMVAQGIDPDAHAGPVASPALAARDIRSDYDMGPQGAEYQDAMGGRPYAGIGAGTGPQGPAPVAATPMTMGQRLGGALMGIGQRGMFSSDENLKADIHREDKGTLPAAGQRSELGRGIGGISRLFHRGQYSPTEQAQQQKRIDVVTSDERAKKGVKSLAPKGERIGVQSALARAASDGRSNNEREASEEVKQRAHLPPASYTNQMVDNIMSTRQAPVTSDRDAKTGIRHADTPVDHFLDAIHPVSFRYKEPEVDGEGERVGIIAQDAAKTPVGRTMIRETPRGLAIDTNAGLSTAFASLAALDDRMRALESRKTTLGPKGRG